MQLATRIRSTAMRVLSSQGFAQTLQRIAKSKRTLARQAPCVHYFHQVDDPYSHLAVQKLDHLRAQYALPFIVHLVSESADDYKGSADDFAIWAQRDAVAVAAGYATTLSISHNPTPSQVLQANRKLSPHLTSDTFARIAQQVGNDLWTNNLDPEPSNEENTTQTNNALAAGNALREKLGHYAGAMFYFDGEWFWGLDRLHLLESRLIAEGFAPAGTTPSVPLPKATDTTGLNAHGVTLEYFPSLRSPYTAIGHSRVLALIERSGVNVHLRPVMPMLMRGVPAPRAKQRYIITDSGREGRLYNDPLARVVDPFGEPVKTAFNLYAGAVELGQGMDFVTAYLRAAWQNGVDITTTQGLQQVAQDAGIDWRRMVDAADTVSWEALLDDNLQALTGANLWGVPSFRVSGGNNPEPFICWGQDRIWRVEEEIAQRVG